MALGSIVTIVLLTSAAVWQLSEAGCNFTRVSCDPINKCKPGWTCLGPEGNKTCYKCNCNHLRECELNSNGNVMCNCNNSNGYTGDFCKCPPVGPGESNVVRDDFTENNTSDMSFPKPAVPESRNFKHVTISIYSIMDVAISPLNL